VLYAVPFWTYTVSLGGTAIEMTTVALSPLSFESPSCTGVEAEPVDEVVVEEYGVTLMLML
jgi:hypothetical protein